MTKTIQLFFFLAISSSTLFGQSADSLTTNPFQISFIYPLGTNGVYSQNIENNVSINIIGGYNGGLDGIEVGGYFNVLRYNMNGIQLCGFTNVVMGQTEGIQLAGFANVGGDTVKGLQMAGYANVNARHTSGLQAAGFANVNGGSTHGVQLAGFANVNGGQLQGPAIAGFANIVADSSEGVQLAGFANISGSNVDGSQISGFLNVCKTLNGCQLGFINIADTVESGLALGFLSIVKKGYWAFELESNESFYTSAQLKTGTEKLYNVFSLSIKPQDQRLKWAYGYGLGTNFTLANKLDANLEISSHYVMEDGWYNQQFNSLNRLKFNISREVVDGVSIYGGPSYNISISSRRNDEGELVGSEIMPWTFTDEVIDNKRIKSFAGLNAGIRF